MDSIIRDIPIGETPRRLVGGRRRTDIVPGQARADEGPRVHPLAPAQAPGMTGTLTVATPGAQGGGPSRALEAGSGAGAGEAVLEQLRAQVKQLQREAAALQEALGAALEAAASAEARARSEAAEAVAQAEAAARAEMQRTCVEFEQRQRQALDEAWTQVRAEAHAEGWASGQAEGRADASARAAAAREEECARFADLFEQVREAMASRLEQAEDMMVEVAYAAACRVVGQVQANKEGVAALVRQALAEVRERKDLTVALHPDDLDALQACLAAAPPGSEFVADPAVRLGGCEVRSHNGTLDARLEVQLAQLAGILLAVRAARRESTRMPAT